MNCEAVRSLSDLYAEKRLTPARQAQVAAHLEACSACAGRLKPASLPAPAVTAPKGFREKLKMNLARTQAEPAPPKLDFSDWPVLAAAAACACLALMLYWLGPGVPSQKYADSVAASGTLP